MCRPLQFLRRLFPCQTIEETQTQSGTGQSIRYGVDDPAHFKALGGQLIKTPGVFGPQFGQLQGVALHAAAVTGPAGYQTV